jgi:hypothetical protein
MQRVVSHNINARPIFSVTDVFDFLWLSWRSLTFHHAAKHYSLNETEALTYFQHQKLFPLKISHILSFIYLKNGGGDGFVRILTACEGEVWRSWHWRSTWLSLFMNYAHCCLLLVDVPRGESLVEEFFGHSHRSKVTFWRTCQNCYATRTFSNLILPWSSSVISREFQDNDFKQPTIASFQIPTYSPFKLTLSSHSTIHDYLICSQ